MIIIKCEKCDYESSNSYTFCNKRFSYFDSANRSQRCHLCDACQTKLQSAIDKTIAKFLGEDTVRDWSENQGVV
jgi:hypothetical protein